MSVDLLAGAKAPSAYGNASRERRLAYVTHASRMVDFLLGEGIALRHYPYWPDYHSDLPGASIPGRAVFAELFDARKLGKHRSKLRPNWTPRRTG